MDLAGPSAAARAPLEVLEMIFQHLLTESQDVRTKIRLMTEIGLVCKAWMSAVEAVAVDILPLDPLDPEAVAYFDPAKDGPGAKLLPLVHSCCFVTMPNQCKDESAVGDAETELESEPGQDEPGSGPADPAQDDLESSFASTGETDVSSETADSLVAILAHMPNIQELMTAEGTESVIKRAFCGHDPKIVWPRLVRMALFWGAPIPSIYPVLARLSCLTDLASLDVWFSLVRDDDDNDPEDDDADITAAANQVQPLNNLQNFVVTAREAEPDLLAPFVNLLSPAADAPLRTVSWLSRVPAGLFQRLSQGTQPLRRLTLGCFTRPEQYVREVWPQLRNVCQRPIMNLCVDLPSQGDDDDDDDEEEDQDEDLTVEEFLRDLPPTIKLVETTRSAKEEDRDPYVFDPGFHNQFLSSILARPHAPFLTLHKDGSASASWKGKPRAQTVALSVRVISPDHVKVTVSLKLARYYDEPGAAAPLSEWHIVSPDAIDMHGDRDPSADPEALTDLIVRGLISQLS